MKAETHDKLVASRRDVQLVADDLETLAHNLSAIGLHDLSKKLGFAVGELNAAAKRIDQATGEAVRHAVEASHEATSNMVRAAFAMVTDPERPDRDHYHREMRGGSQ